MSKKRIVKRLSLKEVFSPETEREPGLTDIQDLLGKAEFEGPGIPSARDVRFSDIAGLKPKEEEELDECGMATDMPTGPTGVTPIVIKVVSDDEYENDDSLPRGPGLERIGPPGGPKLGSPDQALLTDEELEELGEMFSTGGAGKAEGVSLNSEAPKVPGGGPEYEYDAAMESEEEFGYGDEYEDSDLEPEYEDEPADEDEEYLRQQGYYSNNTEGGERSFRDIEFGDFVDPDDLPW